MTFAAVGVFWGSGVLLVLSRAVHMCGSVCSVCPHTRDGAALQVSVLSSLILLQAFPFVFLPRSLFIFVLVIIVTLVVQK